MATKKNSKRSRLTTSWKSFFYAASVTLNIAFVVVFVTMISTNALDGMLMKEGLNRYCSEANDKKFEDNPAKTQALRDFTCAKGEAQDDFETAVNAYLKSRGLE